MNRIAWTEPAVTDLNGIHDYISRDSEVYADAVLFEIFTAVDQLAHYAQSGRIIPETDEENTREILVGNYRIMYELRGETIRILTVLHGARQFPQL